MFAGLARWIGFLTMAAGATAIILLAVGFGWFIVNIAGDEVTLDTRADGIVALTGAAARIPDAIELLATDRGKRLLITGVHRATSSKEIARLTPLYSRYFTCCIDPIGRTQYFRKRTRNKTLGPREQLQFADCGDVELAHAARHGRVAHQLPDVTLIAYPVISEKVKTEPWWSNLDTARFLFAEYLKYVLALARMHLVDSAV